MASNRRDDKGERGANQTRDTTVNQTRSNVTTTTRDRSPSVSTRANVESVVRGGLVTTDRITTRPDTTPQSLVGNERSDVYNGNVLTTPPTISTPPALTPPTAGVTDPNVKASTREQLRKSGFLKIDLNVPDIRDGRKHNTDKSLTKEKSDARPRDEKKNVFCKERPKDNRPKEEPRRGGGGGGTRFVPWKGTKYGC